MNFKIEQVALYPKDPGLAIQLLTDMGLGDWARDHVEATGSVYGTNGKNGADLAFNYDATAPGRLELEVLNYTHGANWMDRRANHVSHLGMHVTAEELRDWRNFFALRDIQVAQEVWTDSHTNPVIAGKRSYNYVIFDTHAILGVDVKFIVRIEL